MGANTSSNFDYKKEITKSVMTAINDNSQDCSADYIANQRLTMKIIADGCDLNIGNIQNLYDGTSEFKCIQSSANMQDVAQAFTTNLERIATNKNSGIPFAINTNVNNFVSDISKDVETMLVNKTTKDCIQSKILDQRTNMEINCSNGSNVNIDTIGNIINDTAVMSCIQDDMNKINAKIDTYMTDKSTMDNTNVGLDPTAFLIIYIVCGLIGFVVLIVVPALALSGVFKPKQGFGSRRIKRRIRK